MSKGTSKYDKHSQAQYAALGRFVEAFEAMVDQTRNDCISLLAANTMQADWLSVPFYHQVMTAKPLFEILRGVIAQMINDEDFRAVHGITNAEQTMFLSVLAHIASEHETLTKTRNDLLHGTWGIQFRASLKEFTVERRRVGKLGLSSPDGLPKNVAALDELSQRCREVAWWIRAITGCMPIGTGDDLTLTKTFIREGREWVRIWPPPSRGKFPDH